jgi:hypothetical protein
MAVASPTLVASPVGVAPLAVDEVLAQPLEHVDDFTFNEKVAGGFDDMASRSVPQYAEIQRAIRIRAVEVSFKWCNFIGIVR